MNDTFLYISNTSWAALAAVAATISAAASWRAVSQSRKASDAQLINELRKSKEEYERRLLESRALSESPDGTHPWYNVVSWWFDHVELVAHMCNKKVISRSGVKFIEPMVIEWIHLIRQNNLVRDHMIASVSGPTTYNEIRIFMKRHRKQLGEFSKAVEEAATKNAIT